MNIRNLFVVLALVTCSQANADQVVLNFSGHIVGTGGDEETEFGRQLSYSIRPGDSFRGSLTFDLADSSYHETSQWNDTWWWTSSNNRMSIQIGDYTFSPSTSYQRPLVAAVEDKSEYGTPYDKIYVYNDFGPVDSLVNSATGLSVDPNLYYFGNVQWVFNSAFPYSEAISMASISELVYPDLSKWETSSVGITLGWIDPTSPTGNYTGRYFNGLVTSIGHITSPVPEPETYAMMLAGLGLLGVVARRRKQKLSA